MNAVFFPYRFVTVIPRFRDILATNSVIKPRNQSTNPVQKVFAVKNQTTVAKDIKSFKYLDNNQSSSLNASNCTCLMQLYRPRLLPYLSDQR